MSGVLDAILLKKHDEIRALRAKPCPKPVLGRPRGGLVRNVLRREPGTALHLIAEIKRRSPSAGPLSTALSVDERAIAYARAGARMISVLCDETFFDGGYEHLAQARTALKALGFETPLLAKEFILDARQLEEAVAFGADAALLIARIVDRPTLSDLIATARRLGLEPLVEVATEAELSDALSVGASLIGVNARDLDSLAMNAPRAAGILAQIPEGALAVHLSGLRSPEDVAPVARSRADAALVGEALMRMDDPAPLLLSMGSAASG
jgi:indole-3-glycerol phosphate synthase